MAVTVKVEQDSIDLTRMTWSVRAATTSSALASVAPRGTLKQEEEAAAAAGRGRPAGGGGGGAPAKQYPRLRCDHPLFKHGTQEQLKTVLAAAPVGEVMFRPSLKGPDHMTACIKLSETGPLLHVNILMEDKKAPAEIGNKLIIGRDAAKGSAGEVFHDLDEICARYVEPLVESVREAAKHRKFAAEPAAEVEAKLKNCLLYTSPSPRD